MTLDPTHGAGPADGLLDPAALDALESLMRGRRAVALAGAGMSTESGIPDYRGPEGRLRVRSPVQYNDFVRSDASRRRYWARSVVGWSRVKKADPNPAHFALAALESAGHVNGVITQNVDGLHQAAGSHRVIELHGNLAHVVCLECEDRRTRVDMQEDLAALNADWLEAREADDARIESAPDGDAELVGDPYDDFVVPGCRICGGILKPDVVFFGENVPKPRVDEAWSLLDAADVLLILGSSLTVFSGRRFVYGANEREMPVAVVNLGPTRADEVAAVKVEGQLGVIVPDLAERLG
ncbi:MAG: NAD-dependent protein deacetylase [Gemmatimonadota bacterium]